MFIEVKVPVLPESVADATVATWHKKAGDWVERDENLVDIETDKVMLEVPAPESGILQEICEAEGSTVLPEQVLAMVDNEAQAAAEPVAAAATAAPVASPEPAVATTAAPAPTAPAAATPTPSLVSGNATAGPAARREAAAHDVDTSEVPGSGKAGRVTKQDVRQFVEQGGARPEQRVPMTRLRARIAERLVEAQHNAAMLTTFNEVNMQPVMDMRAKYKELFEKQHGVRLGFLSFFVKAVIEALKRFPAVNASIDGSDIIYHGYYDIGIAVSTERGLVVPVVRDADSLSMASIEGTVADSAKRARDNKLTVEEMTGGTFTITNGGVFGSLLATPILNPPQVGILGMHKIEQRPVVENGEIVIRPMMYVALTYDHRIIDGRESVQFLVAVKELLEDPSRLLLEI